jgi:hypothetical protein
MEEHPLCSGEDEHGGEDERRALPDGDGAYEEGRGGCADGGALRPLGEGEEGLTVDRSRDGEGDHSVWWSEPEPELLRCRNRIRLTQTSEGKEKSVASEKVQECVSG